VLYRGDVERLWPHLRREVVIIHLLSSSEGGLLARNTILSTTPLDSDIVPVGRPTADKEILLLDEDRQGVENGEIGEIAVRTEKNTLKYWRRPELEAENYLTDPRNPSGRIFLTGDLGRFRPDGQLEFIGRKDFRVKIRGFSVDLAAIETVLNSIPSIRRAVVLVQESPEGIKRLLAYVAARDGVKQEPRQLRQAMAARLPEVMLPHAFIFLDQLPLTSSGKVDRKSLPAPDWVGLDESENYTAPANPLEEKIARIWQKVLKLPLVGVRDRFMEIGGDSLLAMSMFLALEEELGLRLPPSLLIDHNTVETLAKAISQLDVLGVRALVPLKVGTHLHTPLYLVPGALGDATIWKQALPYFGEDRPLYGLQALRRDGDTLYSLTIEKAAAVFLKSIRDFQPEGPYYLAGYSVGGLIAFEIARQLAALGQRVAFLGIVDSTAPGRREEAVWTDRLRLHLDNLRAGTWRERLEYLNERAARSLLRLSRNKLLRQAVPLKKVIGSDPRKATTQASRSYHPTTPVPGPMVIYQVSEEPWFVRWDRMKGWRDLVLGELKIIRIPGTHGNIMKEPYVRELVLSLQAEMENVV
jgi:thioesterase domain-containing protein/acyl carrier protein